MDSWAILVAGQRCLRRNVQVKAVGIALLRRDLLSLLPDAMFSFAITNSCIDSACLFAIFLALLPNKPTEPSTHSEMKEAVEQMIATICWLLDKENIEETTLINIVVSDGESIVATRFVTNAQEVAYGERPDLPCCTELLDSYTRQRVL